MRPRRGSLGSSCSGPGSARTPTPVEHLLTQLGPAEKTTGCGSAITMRVAWVRAPLSATTGLTFGMRLRSTTRSSLTAL
eukprot:1065484-Alexandrium_andersonii.AAC.1